MSHVKKKLYIFFFSFSYIKKLDKVVELVGGGSVINGATPSSFYNWKTYLLPFGRGGAVKLWEEKDDLMN